MEIWGLTGGMASGKSTVARLFRKEGVPVFDADGCVRNLQDGDRNTLARIESTFPGIVQHGRLDRAALRQCLMREEDALHRLEQIMHPLVARKRNQFLQQARHRPLVVLDVPLLWESGCDALCQKILVTTAPPAIIQARLARRRQSSGAVPMSAAESRFLLSRQMSDSQRCAMADIVLKTGLSRYHMMCLVRRLLWQFRQGCSFSGYRCTG